MTCEVCCSHTHSVGCSRLLSAVNDLTTSKKKTCESVTLNSLVRKRLQQVALFHDAAHFTSSEVIDFDEFMSSTSGHSTATMMCWMKKTTDGSLFSRLTVKTVHLC